MEGATGAVPAVLEDLRHILHALPVHPGFQRLLQFRTQAARGGQPDPLDGVQMHDLFAAVYVFQGHIHAGDGLLGHEHRIVHAEAFAGLDLDIAVLELILTEDDAIHALALEVDLQCGQGHAGNVLEGQADRVVAADLALEQLHADELHRAAGSVVIRPRPGDRIKIFLHNTRSLRGYSLPSGFSGASCSG